MIGILRAFIESVRQGYRKRQVDKIEDDLFNGDPLHDPTHRDYGTASAKRRETSPHRYSQPEDWE